MGSVTNIRYASVGHHMGLEVDYNVSSQTMEFCLYYFGFCIYACSGSAAIDDTVNKSDDVL